MTKSVGAILFDLDGTLVDSGADIAGAVNEVRAQLGLSSLTTPAILSHVGEGARHLLERCLAEVGDVDLDAAFTAWLRYYEAHAVVETRPYPGIPELLRELGDLPMGIVSNKPFALVSRIVKAFSWEETFAAVIGGDTLPEKKPHPAPLLHMARLLGVEPAHCLLVGDGTADVLGGRAAGIPVCAVTWGFLSRARLEEAGPDLLVSSPHEILALTR
jgi:phosphoglycolate phosphatase